MLFLNEINIALKIILENKNDWVFKMFLHFRTDLKCGELLHIIHIILHKDKMTHVVLDSVKCVFEKIDLWYEQNPPKLCNNTLFLENNFSGHYNF